MINRGNGEISIGHVTIGPNYTTEMFINSQLYDYLLREDHHVYTSFYLKPQNIDSKLFSITLHFDQKNTLKIIMLSILPDGHLPTWDNWSKEDQLKIKSLNDKWLKTTIGRSPYNYSWGEIFSEYDPRSGSSIITIRYY